MTQLALFIQTLLDKIKTYPTIVSASLGETQVLGKNSASFPKAEILITKKKENGYVDQFKVENAYRFSIGCYVRSTSDKITDQRMYDLMDFASFVDKKIKEMQLDKQAQGDAYPLQDFIGVSGFTETFYEYELDNRTDGAIIVAEVIFHEDFR